jgi:ATP synthase subunit 6
MFFDIIEQFDVYGFIQCIKFEPFYILENLFLILFLVVFLYWLVPNRKNYGLFYFFFKAFFSIVKFNLKEKFLSNHIFINFQYLFYILFLFILWFNITGMIPEVLTLTSFLVLPGFLSIFFFSASFLFALIQNKFYFIKGYLPKGVPAWISVFLFIIEFISYFIRVLSLAVRLFINILAGHLLLKIFSIIMFILIQIVNKAIIFGALLNGVLIAFIFLEYAASLLQAIVFTSLVAIYIDNAFAFFH